MEPDTVRPPVLSVLYVDDEPILLDVCKLYLERRPDISVSIASSVENALKLLDTTSFDVIISDYQMPGTDGIDFLKILNEKHSSIPFIFFTGIVQDEVMTEAFRYGAMFYIQKDGNPRLRFAELECKIRQACQWHTPEETLHKTGVYYNTAV
jgi:CheY-like chemotaxis protein